MNKNLRNIVLTPKNDKLKLWQEGKKIQVTRAASVGNPLTMYNVSTGNVIQQFSQSSVTNLVTNGDFSNGTTGWAGNGVTISASNNELTNMVTSQSPGIGAYKATTLVVGHKYYISAEYNPKYANNALLGFNSSNSSIVLSKVNAWNKISVIKTATITNDYVVAYHDCNTQYLVGDTFKVKQVYCVDLSATFGDNNIPTQAWLDANIPFFNGTTTLPGLAPLVTHGDFGYIGGTEDTYTFDMGIKVAGSVVECPLKIYRNNASTLLIPSDASWAEETTQAEIDKVKTQDNNSKTYSTSVSTYINQVLLELDLTPLCNQKYGGSNAAMKADLKSIQADIWAKGSGANGGILTDGVKVRGWWAAASGWADTNYTTTIVASSSSTTIEKISDNATLNPGAEMITSTNKIYILIHATYPSDGVIPSSVSLDFAQIKITTNRVADTVTPKQVYLPRYWMMCGSFSPCFDSSNSLLKRIFTLYSSASNRWSMYHSTTSGIWGFQKRKNDVVVALTSSVNTFNKSQVYRFIVGQNASGMFMYLLKNNGTIEKIINTDVDILNGQFGLYSLIHYGGVEQADMFSDQFQLYDLQALGKPNGFSDAEYEGILRGRVGTKNLFDGQLEAGTLDISSGQPLSTADRIRSKNFMSISGNKPIIMSNDKGATVPYLYFYDINKNFISCIAAVNGTTPSNCVYVKFKWNITGSDLTTKVQLEEGSTATTYEPYLENPLAIQQKNLFDINAMSLHANATRSGGVITLNATGAWQGSMLVIPVLPNNTYTMKGTVTASNGIGVASITALYNNIALKYLIEINNGTNTVTFTTPSNCNFIRIALMSDSVGIYTFKNFEVKLKM